MVAPRSLWVDPCRWVEWILKAYVLENKAGTQCVHNAEPERSLILITWFERWHRQFDYVTWANSILLCKSIKGSLNAGDRMIWTTSVLIKADPEIKVRSNYQFSNTGWTVWPRHCDHFVFENKDTMKVEFNIFIQLICKWAPKIIGIYSGVVFHLKHLLKRNCS